MRLFYLISIDKIVEIRILKNDSDTIAGSSNGRTAPSEGVYLGSNPGPAAKQNIKSALQQSQAA